MNTTTIRSGGLMSSTDADARFVRDRMEFTNLLHSYAHHADAKDYASFLGLFRDDATIQIGPGPVTSKADFAKGLGANTEDLGRTRHVMTNMVVRSQTADEATGALYFVFTRAQNGKALVGMTGQYNFTVRRGDAGWGIKSWQAVIDA